METQTAVMTTEMVANKLVEFCRRAKNTEAIEQLYAGNIRSLEPKGSQAELTLGKVPVLVKDQQWRSMVQQINSVYISDPVITGNYFSCGMDIEVVLKETGRRITLNEICVYEVQNGKIVFEQFFYAIKH